MSHHPIIEWSPESCLVIDPSTHTIHQAVTPTEALAKIGSPRRIILALGRRQTFSKTIRLPDVPIEQARDLVRFRLDDLFPISASEAAYDLIQTQDVDAEGRECIVFAAKRETINQAKALFLHAGAKVEQVIPAALGSDHTAEPQLQSIVVSPCAEGVAFDLVDHGHTSYSRVTGNIQTTAEFESELTRATAATGVAHPTIVVHNSLLNLAPQSAIPAPRHPLESLAHHIPALNLRLPEEMAKAAGAKLGARKRLALILSAALLAACAIAWSQRDEEAAKVRSVEEKAQKRLASLKKQAGLLTTEETKLRAQSDLIIDGIEPRQALSDVLTVAANAAPDGLWLSGITVERGKDLALRGTAASNAEVGQIVDALNLTPRLRDVKLVFSNNNTIGEIPVVQFAITAHIVGNVPLVDPKKKNTKSGARK
jgi:hypothetical protein